MLDIIVIVVMCAIGLMLGLTTYQVIRYRDIRRGYAATLRAMRWWMVPAAICHIAVLATVIVILLQAIPPLRFGWWMALGGSGNIALGQTGRPGAWWNTVAVGVPLRLLLLLPVFADREEIVYRYGSEEDSRGVRLRRQAVFGLGHALFMGVPIAAGVALIGSGVLYQMVYLRSFKRQLAGTDLATPPVSPVRKEYPSRPAGPYDPAAWRKHHIAVESVGEENRRLLDAWFDTVKEQNGIREDQIDDIRERAATVAAALHTVTNGIIVATLIVLVLLLATVL